jgi:hypothetical protein
MGKCAVNSMEKTEFFMAISGGNFAYFTSLIN